MRGNTAFNSLSNLRMVKCLVYMLEIGIKPNPENTNFNNIIDEIRKAVLHRIDEINMAKNVLFKKVEDFFGNLNWFFNFKRSTRKLPYYL